MVMMMLLLLRFIMLKHLSHANISHTIKKANSACFMLIRANTTRRWYDIETIFKLYTYFPVFFLEAFFIEMFIIRIWKVEAFQACDTLQNNCPLTSLFSSFSMIILLLLNPCQAFEFSFFSYFLLLLCEFF